MKTIIHFKKDIWWLSLGVNGKEVIQTKPLYIIPLNESNAALKWKTEIDQAKHCLLKEYKLKS